MTQTQLLITCGMLILGTVLTRFLPFLLFPSAEKTPKYIGYLGKVLPAAMFGLIVVYALRNTDILGAGHGITELVAVALTVGLHLWKRKMLLSIVGGTVVYMLLVQLVF